MAIFRVLTEIITDTDKEKIDLGITKLEDYMEIFSKFQNQYMEENMSDKVVDIELEVDEWKNIVENMPYKLNTGIISIVQIDNEKYLEITDIPQAKIIKTENKVFLVGEPYEGIGGKFHNDISKEIVIMIKDINESKSSNKFPNIHYFFEPILKGLPRRNS